MSPSSVARVGGSPADVVTDEFTTPTAEVGRVRIVKTESKGEGNKRVRLEVLDAPGDV